MFAIWLIWLCVQPWMGAGSELVWPAVQVYPSLARPKLNMVSRQHKFKAPAMPDKIQVALIEVGTSHDECLGAQIAYLKHHGCGVHLILNDKVVGRTSQFDGADQIYKIGDPQGPYQRWKAAYRIKEYLSTHSIQAAVFNTAHGKVVRNFCLIADRQTPCLKQGDAAKFHAADDHPQNGNVFRTERLRS